MEICIYCGMFLCTLKTVSLLYVKGKQTVQTVNVITVKTALNRYISTMKSKMGYERVSSR